MKTNKNFLKRICYSLVRAKTHNQQPLEKRNENKKIQIQFTIFGWKLFSFCFSISRLASAFSFLFWFLCFNLRHRNLENLHWSCSDCRWRNGSKWKWHTIRYQRRSVWRFNWISCWARPDTERTKSATEGSSQVEGETEKSQHDPTWLILSDLQLNNGIMETKLWISLNQPLSRLSDLCY